MSQSAAEDVPTWDARPLPELIAFILDRYHAKLRRELPELVALAAKVEARHDDKPSCPRGLAEHLRLVHAAVLEHLEKERDVSPNTLAAYRRDLTAFGAYLGQYYGTGDWSWAGVDRLAMRGFLGHLTRRGLARRSIARMLSAVRSFYRFLHRDELVDAVRERYRGVEVHPWVLEGRFYG